MNKQQQDVMDEFINRRAGKPHGASSYNINGVEFTLEEFTQRAKELGWINGYKWGVEYPTNRKKPDLPDDVLVEAKAIGFGWGNKFKVGNIVFDSSQYDPVAFRIVDERYKPKAESVTDMLKAADKPYQLTEKDLTDWVKSELEKPNPFDDNSWHERGEFPPAGIECEVNFKHKWYKTKIVGMNDEFCVFDCRNFSDALYEGYDDPSVFRPIKTEREKFFDAALAVMQTKRISNTQRKTINRLYDSGFRAPK